MEVIFITLIFLIVVFLYIHLYFHLKTSNDLEIYEVASPHKERLEQLLDLRQPVLLTSPVTLHDSLLPLLNLRALRDKYAAFEVKVRRTSAPEYVTTTLGALGAKDDDLSFSENNADFLKETSLRKTIHDADAYFRPYLVCRYDYDWVHLPLTSATPLRYELAYRNFIVPTDGEIVVKLAPPKAGRYLDTVADYELLEFRANNPAENTTKVHFLEVRVKPGQVLSIPAYWWYNVTADVVAASFLKLQYITFGNLLAVSPHYVRHLLQLQNIQNKSVQVYQTLSPSHVVNAAPINSAPINYAPTNSAPANSAPQLSVGDGGATVGDAV